MRTKNSIAVHESEYWLAIDETFDCQVTALVNSVPIIIRRDHEPPWTTEVHKFAIMGLANTKHCLSSGRVIGGVPFGRGPLGQLLRSQFYIGKVAFKGEVFPGEQPAILDRKLFEAVQRKLDQQRTNHSITRTTSESLLVDRIFDDRGNRMTPSSARKKGRDIATTSHHR